MSDWKGPNKCQKCGRIIEHLADFRNDIHLTTPPAGGVGWCDGTWELYDRRAPADGMVEEVRWLLSEVQIAGHMDPHGWTKRRDALLERIGDK